MPASMPSEPPGHARKMAKICSDRSAFDEELLDRVLRYLKVHAMELGFDKPRVSEEQAQYWTRTVATLIIEMFAEADLVFITRKSMPRHIDDDDDDGWL